MRRLRHRPVLWAALLAASAAALPDACADGSSPADPGWQVLVPAGRFGRFGLRVERAELAGSVSQAAARIASAWGEESRPMLRGGNDTAPSLSRLTPVGIETIALQAGTGGRVEAIRSVLAWRGAHNGSLPEMPTPVFVAALDALGPSLPGFASADAGSANLTRIWLSPGDVGALEREVERIAAAQGLARLMRFDAPAGVAESLRGGRVLAFGGTGVVAVVTFIPHPAGVAIVVHCQERMP